MNAYDDFLEINMEKQNTSKSHISFVDGDSHVSSKYKESYSNSQSAQRVMLYDKFEIGAIVNHTPYSPDMDGSGSARVFKINPELSGVVSGGLYAEDLVRIAQEVSGVSNIPVNSEDTPRRKDRPNWDDWIMGMCFWVSMRSPDTSTAHGAVLCDKHHRVLGIGYNGFPRGCDDAELPTTRPLKYSVTLHAEENCLLNSQNLLLGSGHIMYITGFPCPNCFIRMIQCGIQRVVYGPVVSLNSSPYADPEKIELVHKLAEMTDIQIDEYKGCDFRKNMHILKEIVCNSS